MSARNAMRVMAVDDNRDAADSLGVVLRLWGYDVRVVYDGETALREAREFKPDCLLLDVAMPRMDGCTLARRLRADPVLGRAKLIALTAYSDAAHTRQIKDAGFDHHMVKPADLSEIERTLAMLDQVLRRAGRTEELAQLNVALAGEARDLLKEVKQDIKEVKDEVKEVKEKVLELREELKEVKDDIRRGQQ